MILGITAARGGSKGIPNKNIRPVLGKPLIAYTIETALQVPCLDHYIVSTDSDEIIDLSKSLGAEVIFKRPPELAQDTTAMLPVLEHALLQAETHYQQTVKALVLLDPTAPLRIKDDVTKAFELFKNNDCDAVISCNLAHRSPYFNMIKDQGDYVELVNPLENEVTRRQDSPQVFDLNTVVWIFSRKAIVEYKVRIPKKSVKIEIPAQRAIDIDHPHDLNYLEFLLSQKKEVVYGQ